VLIGALVAGFAFAPAAHAGGPSMLLGATEDAVRSTTPGVAKARMDLIALAGFDAVRITEVWAPGEIAVPKTDASILRNVTTAATLDDVTVLVSVLNFGSRTTPLSDQDQSDFAAFAASVVRTDPAITHVIVGNEPNLNRYWLPQFNLDGSDAAAPAYESLLARTYDAVKAVRPTVEVIGGAVSPRGGDVPGTGRDTHSPTVFIADMGTAYHASGRTTPIMDAFAFHPYEDNSSIAPDAGVHPPPNTTIALADYDKLAALLVQAFGSPLPVYYDEFGVESIISPAKQGLYTGAEPTTTHPVDEATQAAYYREAVALAFCQPTVRGLFLFHAFDEPALAGWQSGVYYADETPKASLAAVRLALQQSRRGVIAACPGLALTPKPSVVQSGKVLTLTCDIDCSYVAQLYRLPGKLLVSKHGLAVGARATTLPLRVPVAKARYRLRLSATAPVNTGPAALRLVAVAPG